MPPNLSMSASILSRPKANRKHFDMARVLVLGEALFDLFAEPGVGLAEARSFTPMPGGASANVAVALARLGADVGFIGKVGDDPFGRALRSLMTGAGVDVAGLLTDARAPTMLGVVARPSPDAPRFILYHGANRLLEPKDISLEAVRSATALVFSSTTLASESRAAALYAAQAAREAGLIVLFDINLRPSMWADSREIGAALREAFALATMVKANREELAIAVGESDLQLGAAALLDLGPDCCVVSLGAEGAFFATRASSGQVSAPCVQAIDTTGCGDAFVGVWPITWLPPRRL
jgi:fructokinase